MNTQPNERPEWDTALQTAIDAKLLEYAKALTDDIHNSCVAMRSEPTSKRVYTLWDNYENTFGRELRVLNTYYEQSSHTNPAFDELHSTFLQKVQTTYPAAIRHVIQTNALEPLNALKQKRNALQEKLREYTWLRQHEKQALHTSIGTYSKDTNALRKTWGALFEPHADFQNVPALLKSVGFGGVTQHRNGGWTFDEGKDWRDVSNGASNKHGKGDLERAARADPKLLLDANAALHRLYLLKNVGEYTQELRPDATDIETLERQVQKVLLVGNGGITANEFENRFDVHKPAYGFQAEFHALQRLHATRMAYTVQHSKAMREVLGVRTQQGNALIEALMQLDTGKMEKLNSELAQSRKAVEAAGGDYEKSYNTRMYNALEAYNIALRKTFDLSALFSGKLNLDKWSTKSPIPLLEKDRFTKGKYDKTLKDEHGADPAELSRIVNDDDIRWLYLSLLHNKHNKNRAMVDDSALKLAIQKPHLFQESVLKKDVLKRMNTLEMAFANVRPQFDWQSVMFDLWKANPTNMQDVLNQPELINLFFKSVSDRNELKKIFEIAKQLPSILPSITYGYIYFWHDRRDWMNQKHYGYRTVDHAVQYNVFVNRNNAILTLVK